MKYCDYHELDSEQREAMIVHFRAMDEVLNEVKGSSTDGQR